MKTLSQRQLNRAVLARQLLLERAAVPVPRALELMGSLQAQYAPSMYIGLWSRVEGFERPHLTGALEQRQAVQGTLQRTTIHLVSAADYWPFALAVRDARRKMWLKAWHHSSAEVIEAAAARVRERLRTGEPVIGRKELDQLVGDAHTIGTNLWVDLVRVPPSGTWERRRADLFALAEDWLGPPPVSVDDALDVVVRRYLGGFGPSAPAELADWAGLALADVHPVIERIPGLRRFRAEDGAELVDLPDAPLPQADTPVPVRFLPTWDAILLVHARRKVVIAEEHRPLVFNVKTPQSVPTFLVDGRVAGTWRYEKGRVNVSPFEPLPPAAAEEVAAEASRLEAFHR